MRIEIRAPSPPGETSSTAIRLVSGGIVRVFFAKQAFTQADSENVIVARAPASDEMLKMFRKTGRLVAGRTLLFARTPGEKSAIEDFFAGCA